MKMPTIPPVSSLQPGTFTSRLRLALQFLLVAGVLTLCFFNVFYRISTPHIQDWDEARHGVSAVEMLESGNYLVNTYQGQTDYWNAKPPLSFAPMVAGFSIFGFNTLGLRFFSGASTVVTAFIIFLFGWRVFRSFQMGVLAAIILLTTPYFIVYHNARSGDADAFFIMLATASLCFALLTKYGALKFYIASIFASFAFLTKSFHTAPLILTLLIYFLMDKNTHKKIFHLSICIFLVLFPIMIWAVLRYQADGLAFFERMLFYDVLARGTSTIEGHTGNAFFYIKALWNNLKNWIYLILSVLFLHGILKSLYKNINFINFKIYNYIPIKIFIGIFIPFFLFSCAKSKLYWYTYYSYPLIVLLLSYIFITSSNIIYIYNKKIYAFIIILLLVFFISSESNTMKLIKKSYKRSYDPIQYEMTAALKSNHDRPIYFYLSNGDWSQKHILFSKFQKNVILKDGGSMFFIQSKNTNKILLHKN